MQTPGLPASSTSSTHNSAENFLSEKPSNAREHFGDVIDRALTSGRSPVRSRPQSQDANSTIDRTTKRDTDENSSSVRHKRSVHRASERTTTETNPYFIAHAAPAAPTPASAPSQTAVTSQDAPDADDSVGAVSADATNTVVTNANPTEAGVGDSAGKPIPGGIQPQAAEITISTEHLPKNPSAELGEAVAKLAAEGVDDPADAALSGDSGLPLAQIAEPKNTAETVSAPPTGSRGTSAAKQDMTMKKADKTQKVAGPAEQDLPGIPASGSEELPKGQKISEKALAHGEKVESTAIELPTRVSTSVNPPSATITSAAPAQIESRVLERTHDIVALHAMRLTDTGADTLHVVVKPGAGIQISLELRQSARGIEVSASLHKGDYDQLSQHWPDLQQRLEARGVRVSTLTPPENYTGTGHFHQSKQQSSQQESLQAGAFAEFALVGSMTESPDARAARASAYRGWETWA